MIAPNVFILTYCRNPGLLYGSLLVFRTLRVGFPNARVQVVDNGSLPETREQIARLAKGTGCAFQALPEPGVAHGSFIERKIAEMAQAPEGDNRAVFVDPDVCLWRNCEELQFEGLAAGLLVEAYNDEVMQCVTMPRLHTSFLWINHPARLMQKIAALRRLHIDFQPFLPYSARLGDMWLRYDTGASLYAAMPEECVAFDASHMEYYDHIYAGSHFDYWQGKHVDELQRMMDDAHAAAKAGDLAALKGLWRRQSEIWYRTTRIVRAPGDAAALGAGTSGSPPPAADGRPPS
jgi:hypothetical protein